MDARAPINRNIFISKHLKLGTGYPSSNHIGGIGHQLALGAYMSPVDRYPQIMFGRTKIALTAMVAGEINQPVKRVDIKGAISGLDTIVAPVANLDVEKLDYYEVLAVHPVAKSAPPLIIQAQENPKDHADGNDVDEDEEDDDYDYFYDDDLDDWGPLTEERSSSEIERHCAAVSGLTEIPVFGRRLLLVGYKQELSQFDMDRAKRHVRKLLGFPTTVWQGRSFVGYCFVDNVAPDRILSRLEPSLLSNDIEDFLLVQPVAMILRDKSGLSPLGDWIAEGWRAPRASTRDHKSGRHERRS